MMRLTELEPYERLALGGLIRLLVRADGDFTAAEEDAIDAIGQELGGKDLLWRAISESAQAFATDQDIRRAGLAIGRAEVRALTLAVLGRIARADTLAPGEQGILEALAAHWEKKA